MVLYFVQQAMKGKKIPQNLIDQNIKIDYKKLRYLMKVDKQLNGNFNRLKSIIEDQRMHKNSWISMRHQIGLRAVLEIRG
jgi:hypothetical protein